MFSLKVVREINSAKAAVGKLFINDQQECYTLEDKVREVPGQAVASWKIPGQTAIPCGTYKVKITFSNHFQRFLPELEDVPGYAGVRIHSGNTDADTEGCILLGADSEGGDYIGRSRVAFESFYAKLQDAISHGEEPTITITNTFA